MQTSSPDRPYRSHSRPACTACRRRKSRCKVVAGTVVCAMCNIHGTDCEFPMSGTATTSTAPAVRPSKRRHSTRIAAAESVPTAAQLPEIQTLAPLSALADDGEENPHIIGPVVGYDNHVLANYLSSTHTMARGGLRLTRLTRSATQVEPVLFTRVQKRPLGLTTRRTNVAALQLEMIEKLLEPLTEKVVDVFFTKVNPCFPLVDEHAFRSQYHRSRVSPALLACLYAHTLTFWDNDVQLASESRRPDGRFVWNLAGEALFAELHAMPSTATLPALLLNIGGRPTTAMMGNGVLLGAAVSLAHALGLNRSPRTWDLSDAEKCRRTQLWRCLLVHDRWASLAYGTPPHIREGQYDKEDMDAINNEETPAAAVFAALVGLTEVLARCLEHVYSRTTSSLEVDLDLHLNSWVDGLPGILRLAVVVRASHQDLATLPGASNLRLAYLAICMLLHRIALATEKRQGLPLANRYMQIRRSAEQIVLLVQQLDDVQLGGFWLPMTAMTFAQTATFLTRCALEETTCQADLPHSPSMRLTADLLAALRHHQQHSDWDLADICISQHADVVERLMAGEGEGSAEPTRDTVVIEPEEDIYGDAFADVLFPSIWDSLESF